MFKAENPVEASSAGRVGKWKEKGSVETELYLYL